MHPGICRPCKDFNPRPREEGDLSLFIGFNSVDISIHALVKRATLSLFIGFNSVDISIHALVKRATALISTKSTN